MRVVATTNRVVPQRPIEVPANAVLVDWLSYSQLMPAASLVISHGGHGTVARALGAGTPVLICPIIGDMSETAMRVAWARAGLSLPWRLCRPAPLRWAARRILGDPSFAAQAGRDRRLGARERRRASAAPSWSRNWRPSVDAVEAPGVGLEPTTLRLTVECSTD